MGREIEQKSFVDSIKGIDISHQEVDRILKALEEMYTETKLNTPGLVWLPVQAVANLLAHELGYEDVDEFEDAMRAPFKDFIGYFPIIELKEDDRVAGGWVFQVKEDPSPADWEPTKLTYKIKTASDLWRVCHKSKFGRICVPSLEFEIQADGQRHIDSLYNHIGGAITNLAAHVSTIGGGMSEQHKDRVLETVQALTQLLDVASTWDLVVYDPSGISEIVPQEGVSIERYNPDED